MKYNNLLTTIFLILISFPVIAQPGWYPLNSGVNVTLNSIYFIDASNGFAAGENGTFLKTTNGGASWTSSTTSPAENLNDVHFFNLNEGILAANGGIIFRTTNGGTSWSVVSTGVTDNLLSLSFNGANGLSGGSSQTIIKSTNSGVSWDVVQTGFFGGGFWGVHMFNSSIGVVAGDNSIFQPMVGKTTDGGLTWDFFPFYLNSNEGRLFNVHFFDANNGITAAGVWDGTGAVSRTNDGGVNWTTQIFGDAFIAMHFPTNAVGYVAGWNGGIHKSTNGGISWTIQPSGTSADLNDIFFLNEFTGFAVGGNGTILKTVDGGVPVELTSFTYQLNGSRVILKWETAVELNNHGFEIERMAESIGNDWIKIGFAEGHGTTTEKQNYQFADDLSRVNASGKISYRLKQIDFDGSYEYSEAIEFDYYQQPESYSLAQNYPNPFNPSTTIEFSLPVDANIKLSVYNLIGEKVAEAVNGSFSAGSHRIDFNAASLTSGLYLYGLDAAGKDGTNFNSVRKMLLLK